MSQELYHFYQQLSQYGSYKILPISINMCKNQTSCHYGSLIVMNLVTFYLGCISLSFYYHLFIFLHMK